VFSKCCKIFTRLFVGYGASYRFKSIHVTVINYLAPSSEYA